jgi:predicted O-methyltransferase YrrM
VTMYSKLRGVIRRHTTPVPLPTPVPVPTPVPPVVNYDSNNEALVEIPGRDIERESGHCWYAIIPPVAPGDTTDDGRRSQLALFEDGKPLGPGHAPHDDIRQRGGGLFSHWGDMIHFSTSDNSDPRSSGRKYTVIGPRRKGFSNTDSFRSALAQSISAEFARLSAGHPPIRQGQVTPTETQFVLTELVRLLAPASVLEIGTFFADTARVVAEAMAKVGAGHLTTIDPFGGHRVPGIIAGWHPNVRDRVTFRSDNSMSFFLYLDNELHVKRGNGAPFNIIYVDGNHTFEYAFFDLMCSSLYLRPGGVFVVDNIDLGGPAGAIKVFLERHTHWKLFKTGGSENDAESLALHPQTNSAMIVAPDGIEIGSLSYQFDLSNLQSPQVHELEIRARRGAAGLLRASTCLYSRPIDYHLTGEGEQARIGLAHHKIDSVAGDTIVIPYEPPITISPRPNDRIAAHVELSFAAEGRENLLVEVEPLTLR